MQAASQVPSWYYHHQIQWEVHRRPEPLLNIQKPITRRPKLLAPVRTLTALNSTKTCKFKFKDYEEFQGQKELVPLPIVIRRSGRVSQYVLDGSRLQLVDFAQTPSDYFESGNGFFQLLRILGSAVWKLFVPQQVQENYMDYLKCKFFHRVFSSALQVIATQAMFRAIGIGSSYSLPSAAAMNWVLKDGLGRLSRCIYTAYTGCSFDTNLKRVRFSTSVLFSLSIGVEMLTPTFPQHFLLLATIANIAKSISLAAYLATGSAIHRSFAIADNLGEVSAKAQIQTVCFDNVGLMLAAILNMLSKNNTRIQAGIPLVIYPVFATMDLFAIYQGLKHVHLQTLTKDRLEIIMEEWIQSGCVLSPAEVSNKEGIDLVKGKGRKLWPIRIGCIDVKVSSQTVGVMTLQSLSDEGLYFICMESVFSGLMRKRQNGILLCLQESIGTSDIIMGLLQACYIRYKLLPSRSSWGSVSEVTSTEISSIPEWFRIVEESKTCAVAEINLLIEEIRKSGWALKNILLSSEEQMRYSLIPEV